jgi:hypothetical protein
MTITLNEIIKNVLDQSIDLTRYVAPWRQTRWIVGSSCFIMIPSIYAFKKKQMMLATTSLLTSLCSINFWRDANYSYRRSADHFMSKLSFIIYVTQSVKQITYSSYAAPGYGGVFMMLYCYYMSNKHGDTELWMNYHMMFHMFISFTQTISIMSLE